MTASTERSPVERGASRPAEPLAGRAGRFVEASADPDRFSVRAMALATQVSLRGNAADPAFAARVRAVFGFDVPVKANTWAGDRNHCALWLGPDEWLVVAAQGRNDALAAALRESLAGLHCAVVDLSANRTIIELGGSDARIVLAKGCPLDLHRDAFAEGQCAQSLLARSQVILQCADRGDAIRLFVRISFAHYVAEWLLDAAGELHAARGAGMLGLRL